jgi:hypothetical protein
MSNADWYARKLSQGNLSPQVGRPDPTPPMPPTQQPMTPMPVFQAQVPVQAPSASQAASCPACNSANFMVSQTTAARCFDCGYPVEQSGSRHGTLTGAHVEGAAKQAPGNDSQNNWNPQGIIGRI